MLIVKLKVLEIISEFLCKSNKKSGQGIVKWGLSSTAAIWCISRVDLIFRTNGEKGLLVKITHFFATKNLQSSNYWI